MKNILSKVFPIASVLMADGYGLPMEGPTYSPTKPGQTKDQKNKNLAAAEEKRRRRQERNRKNNEQNS